MMGAAFSTLALFEQLEGAGVPEKQARIFADLFAKTQKTEELATKSDVENDFKTFEVSVDRKLDQIRHEIKEMRQELKNEIESKNSHLKIDLIKWMIGISFAQASLMIGLKIFG
jgi:hypothetical protein